jgi:CSLREA domain-containing protein
VLALAPAARAATITVTTTTDAVANDGQCSLREAITASEKRAPSGAAAGECTAGSGNDTIVLGAHAYTLSLTGPPDDTNAAGDLDVTAGAITIVGTGQPSTTINANSIDRVFDVLAGASLTLEKLTITGGHAPDGGAGTNAGPGVDGLIGVDGGNSTGGTGSDGAGGGGIRNAGTLVLDDVAVSGDHAGAGGEGGAAAAGGAGGASATGSGGDGGRSTGGTGGGGGSGGGLLSTAGTVTILESSFTGDVSGNGGVAGIAATGGNGGNSGGNAAGGTGGDCIAGEGGSGGSGGAIAITGGTATIAGSQINQNTAGDGATSGGCTDGGQGGNGSGSGTGGAGGYAIGGVGGSGGSGGGVADSGALVTITDTTLDLNHAGNGGASLSSGIGGHGGLGSATSAGGPGSPYIGGDGGEGGSGGGVSSFDSGPSPTNTMLNRVTLAGNVAGNGGAGPDGTSGGTGGAGGGGQGAAGSSDGGIGGDGGFGGGAELDAGFAAANVTATANQAGSGGNAGAGGAGPGESNGGIGGESGEGGLDSLNGEGAFSHVTSVGNLLGTPGAIGGPGTGSPAEPGLAGFQTTGADLGAPNAIEGPTASASASILGICAGTLGDGGGNVTLPATTPTCPGLVANPHLGPLADNGGPTATMALTAGSPAIDLIKPPCGTMPDQRGVPRPQGAGCDAGAYEFAPPDVVTGPPSGVSAKSATVTGTISPNARATTWSVQYGASTAYGKRTRNATLAAGTGADAVKAVLSGLKPHSLLHYRILATNADGTKFGADETLKTTSFTGVTIVSRSLIERTNGRVSVTLGCPAGTSGSCKGKLTITATVKHKRRMLGHATFKVSPGKHKKVTLALGKHARSTVAVAGKHGLAVTLSASARDAAGSRATTKVRGHLKR